MFASEPILSSSVCSVRSSDSGHDQFSLDEQSCRPDPRIQIELENLNASTDLINKLELELNDSRNHFRVLLSDSSQRIGEVSKKLGSCVERARPYYEAKVRAKELQTETQKAALRYERAFSAHMAAKEMVRIAEEGLQKDSKPMDSSWQEVLNHSTSRVNECERQRLLEQMQHQKTSQAYNKCDQQVSQLHQQLKRSISKASLEARRNLLQLNNVSNQHQLQLLPYFEMKAQFNQMLDEQICKIRSYEQRVGKAKLNYSKALHRLEEISDEIRGKRQVIQVNQCPIESRGVGVGAESSVPSSPNLNNTFRRLSLESQTISEIPSKPNGDWFSKSLTNCQKEDCISIDSIDVIDTNDDNKTNVEDLSVESGSGSAQP